MSKIEVEISRTDGSSESILILPVGTRERPCPYITFNESRGLGTCLHCSNNTKYPVTSVRITAMSVSTGVETMGLSTACASQNAPDAR